MHGGVGGIREVLMKSRSGRSRLHQSVPVLCRTTLGAGMHQLDVSCNCPTKHQAGETGANPSTEFGRGCIGT